MNRPVGFSANGYTLVICEKPDVARRVSEALSTSSIGSSSADGVVAFTFSRGSEEFVVCSAQGHLYGISDPFRERAVYPVFDLEWYPLDLVERGNMKAGRIIASIKRMSKGAGKIVNACDFDVEGETIGFNLLRYACAGRENEAFRAKFSTLTKPELLKAIRLAHPRLGQELARAGRARHFIDFAWGINLSRCLSQSTLNAGHRYMNTSIGRVQGPTLRFVVEREREIRQFVPVPFWMVSCTFKNDRVSVFAVHSKGRLDSRVVAQKMRTDCTNGQGIVTAVISNPVEVPPPNPFSLGDLQKDAYRNFGITPSKTLKIVERLYLNALVSYPRTTSQKLSASIDYKAILRRLGRLPEYSTIVEELLNRALRPAEGTKFDQAHPAIHPTGEPPEKHLDSLHMRVYDMIVRRFFAVVAPSAKRELTTLTVRVGGYEFKAAGGRTVTPGWTSYYGKYWKTKDHELPFILEGEHLQVTELKVDEMFDERPFRYNQSTLLEKMERERIGTKATRSDVIDTLIRRGYVAGESLVATELGFSVVESMEEHAPSVVSTGLTRGMEAQLERIERGSRMDGNLVRETVRSVSEQLIELSRNNEAIGRQIGSAFAATNAAGYILGPCPVCRIGDLRVVRSARTRKRFAGCTNYSAGCKASAPLPQCGNIIRTNTGCQSCLWPIIQIAGDRWPWRFCINPKCPSKRR